MLLLLGVTCRLDSNGLFGLALFAHVSHHSFGSELQLTATRLERAKGSVSEEQLHLPPCQPLQLGNLKLI